MQAPHIKQLVLPRLRHGITVGVTERVLDGREAEVSCCCSAFDRGVMILGEV